MAQVLSLRYPRPQGAVSPTAWGRDWRRRWFRNVGTVIDHVDGQGLAALYSDDRDPTARLALQAELEAQPDGVAQVLAACNEASKAVDDKILAANARAAAKGRRDD